MLLANAISLLFVSALPLRTHRIAGRSPFAQTAAYSSRQHPPALGLKELLVIFPTPRALLNILCRIPLSICTAYGLTA
jgi:hypothetical protein